MSVQLSPVQRQRALDVLGMSLPGGSSLSLRAARAYLCREGIQISQEGLRLLRIRGIPTRKSGSGRPKKTSKRQDRALIAAARRHPKAPSAALQADALTAVHKSTVSRRMKAAGLPCRRVRQKPFISQQAREKRLLWARDHLLWTPRQWSRCIWADEKDVQLLKPLHQLVRRPPGTEYEEQYVLL